MAGSQPWCWAARPPACRWDDATTFPGGGRSKLFSTALGPPRLNSDENVLGGGTVSGLLRFQNTDLSRAQSAGPHGAGHRHDDERPAEPGPDAGRRARQDLFALPTSMPGYTNGAGVGTVSFTGPRSLKPQLRDPLYHRHGRPGGAPVRRQIDPFTDTANLATLQIGGLLQPDPAWRPAAPASACCSSRSARPPTTSRRWCIRRATCRQPINAAMGTANGGHRTAGQPRASRPTTGAGSGLTPPSRWHWGDLNVQRCRAHTVAGGVDRGYFLPLSLVGPPPAQYTSRTTISINGWQITLKPPRRRHRRDRQCPGPGMATPRRNAGNRQMP